MPPKARKRTGIPNRILELRTARNLTLQDLEERTGISAGQLNRIEKGERRLHFDNAPIIARALGVREYELLQDVPLSGRVVVKGHVQAGEWTDDPEWPETMWYEVQVPEVERSKGATRHGCEVRGPSMNRVYPEGTVLVWVSLYEDGRPLEDGARYIVRRSGKDDTIELSVKTYRLIDGQAWLVPESDHPAYQNPYQWRVEDKTVEVLGRVIQSVRSE